MSTTTTGTDTQDKKDRFSKDVPWYEKEIQDFNPSGRELLENYSHIPPKDVESHVIEFVCLTILLQSLVRLIAT